MNIFPWQSEVWKSVMSMRQRMPHALLLQGRAAIGKTRFAAGIAQTLLCDVPTEFDSYCGTCPSCTWFTQGNHPDFRLLEPEDVTENESGDGEKSESEVDASAKKGKKKSQIAVHQVRALSDFLGLSSHRQGVRVVLLHPAESLNPAAANALLKMLEEPPPATLFILVSHQPQRLLPTIRSRCNTVIMPPPAKHEAEAWLTSQGMQDISNRLAYEGGSPLAVMDIEGETEGRRQMLLSMLGQGGNLDPLAAAAFCAKDGMPEVIVALQKWIYDLLVVKFCGQVRYHLRQAASMQALVKSVDLGKLLDLQRTLNEARGLAQHPLNVELQLESLLIQYVRMFPSQGRA